MLDDQELMKATARIVQRAERHADIEKIVTTYVEIGLLPQLNNPNHQIFYGRRGTGKTHLLKVLESELSKELQHTIVYIDCRTLGSTSQFSNPDLSMNRRCLALFRDVLLSVCEKFLEHIVERPNSNSDKAFEKLDELNRIVSTPIQSIVPERVITQSSQSKQINSALSTELSLFPNRSIVNASANREKKITESKDTEYSIASEDKIIFPELNKVLSDFLRFADVRLFLLIDEWADLPRDIQPYLAEFLKRGVLSAQAATVKISALEYRCQFSHRNKHHNIGFELGADISTATDLDDYFVFDRNQEQILEKYSDILFKHLEQ